MKISYRNMLIVIKLCDSELYIVYHSFSIIGALLVFVLYKHNGRGNVLFKCIKS